MSTENKKLNILLADDHSLIRQGIVFLLEDMEIACTVSHASNLKQTLHCVQNLPIDLAIIDAHFPEGNSISIIPVIRENKPDIKILIFTGIDENIHALKYINAGANGFLSKLSEEAEIKNAISEIIENGNYVSPVVKLLMMKSFQGTGVIHPLQLLSERELQIGKLYAEGYGNLEIANSLGLKQNTVSTIKKRIFEKLNIKNIVELIEIIRVHD